MRNRLYIEVAGSLPEKGFSLDGFVIKTKIVAPGLFGFFWSAVIGVLQQFGNRI